MIRVGAALMCSVLMGSCAPQVNNDRLVLGSRYQTGSFGGEVSVLDNDQSLRPRDRWPSVIVVAPTDGTLTGQTLRTPKYLKKKDSVSARMYGLFPTVRTAIRPAEARWLEDAMGTLDELGRSFGEMVLMPYRAAVYSFVEPVTWSPERVWKRTNQKSPSSWSSGQPRRDEPDAGESNDATNE